MAAILIDASTVCPHYLTYICLVHNLVTLSIHLVSIKGQIIEFIWKMDRFIVKRPRKLIGPKMDRGKSIGRVVLSVTVTLCILHLQAKKLHIWNQQRMQIMIGYVHISRSGNFFRKFYVTVNMTQMISSYVKSTREVHYIPSENLCT